MSAFQNQFLTKNDVANPAPIKRAVIIASTQRSGSSLLGHTMRDTGAFGVPLEYFNVQNLEHWRKRFAFSSINQLLDQIERCRTTSNGIFAIKSHYFQLRNFGSIRDLNKRYGDCRFVRIVRRDMLAQAISRTVAQQTGVWISGQEATGEARYDFAQIAENLRVLNGQHQQWSLALAATGTPFLEVVHEDLVRDPQKTLMDVAQFCDVPSEQLSLPASQPIEAQKNPRKGEWAERFAADFDEKSDSLLDGYASVSASLKDLGRWLRAAIKGSGDGEEWYRSPNLADE